MRLINTYRPLKRISPLVWIDAGRPLDEKEISAVTLPVVSRNSSGVTEHAGNAIQIRTQRIYTKISTILLVGREIR